MSAQATPAKRPRDQSPTEGNGGRKWQKPSALGPDKSPWVESPASNVIRLLCPVSLAGGIIGKGASNIAQIRHETGARVRVEETVPGCDERVIIIVGSDKDGEVLSARVMVEDKEAKNSEGGENPEDKGKTGEEEKAITVVDSQLEKKKGMSSIQKALLAVFDKMVALLSELNGGDEETSKASSSVIRLLVLSVQVGCLLGKGGSVIKQMSSESGAHIRVLPKDKLPLCASSSDELVQVSGSLEAVKKALQSVSQQLLENSPRNQDLFPENIVGPPRHDRFPPSNRHSSGFHHDREHEGVNFPPDVLSFKVLCSEEKVGGVIGKGGSIVKSLQYETGCEIKVLEGGPDSQERVIVISGPAHPDDGVSPPQDAVLRVQARIFKAAPESKEKILIAKLLVPSHKIGCLLGKGGSVIYEMRKSTGAYIRILGKDQAPKYASENEEVVQVNGEFEVVQEALLQVTTRLRNHFFRDAFPHMADAFPHMGHPPNPAFMEQMPPFPPYMERREFSPSGMYPHRGPPFNNFDGPGSGFHPYEDRPPFAHDFPRPWGPPQGPMDGHGAGHMGFSGYPAAPPRRFGGFPGGNQPAIITNTTVEVVVPRFVVPAIYGEDGDCLRQIREFSDAQVTITDPKPGATETVIIISGTPEQTNAAQSLIQAFVVIETEGS